MNYFLAKTDPGTYSIDDFAKEKATTWSGVRNPQAVLVLKSMKKGDRVFIYHSQGEGSIRGLAEVVGNSRPDPKDVKSWLVDFKFLKKYTEPYTTIKDVKASGLFADFALVTQSRLSTMHVPARVVAWLKQQKLSV
ncbi:MAG: EVE domain-containing protein [Candidatus Doudnabacteria bacterium]|nr:EVE domain-containing protein [Candidatus Doudnabacteria bacterium]